MDKWFYIPFGAKDSELMGFEYKIPDGYEGVIENGVFKLKKTESEDERVIGDLIGGLMWQRDNLNSVGPHDNSLILPGFCLTVGEHIAYLEKQKEQKPVEYLDKDKVYAIMTKLTNLSYSQLIPINSDEFKKLDEITTDVRSLLDYPIEQKPAEWNEEDKRALNDAIVAISMYANGQIPYILPSILLEDVERLKSLHPQSKREWSEEDEMYLSQAIEVLEQEDFLNLADKLKSLRNRPKSSDTWKPSVEQMYALKNSAYGTYQNGDGPALRGLYEQLKKLI